MVKKHKGDAYGAHPTHPSADGNASSTMSVIVLQRSYSYSSEATPLLPRKATRSGTSMFRLRQVRVGGWILALFTFSCFLFMAYHTSMHFTHCPPDPITRDAIRLHWGKEEAQHAVLQDEWKRKELGQSETEKGWKREAERHEREVARGIHEEHVRQEKVRQDWMHEIERHAHEREEMQRREREEWERERESWKREIEGRERREEEERQRLHMFWGRVKANTCTTYATREHTAQLMNLPTSWTHRLDACKATPLEIHGISYLPTTCEDRGPGVVIGRWKIDQQEPDCTTFWDSYNDKGCTSPGSGKKYITHKLMNFPENSDWREFCATTPAHFDHMQFRGAQECFQTVWGVYGQWEIYDSNC